MIIGLLFTGLLFIGVGFLVTKNNASQVLSGYNTMTKAEQDRFNLEDFLPYFKKFHIYLGVSFIVLSIVISLYCSKTLSAIFITAYPILWYVYLIWKTRQFYN